jgi:hypothetical protein
MSDPRVAAVLVAAGGLLLSSGCVIRMSTPYASEADVTAIGPYCASAAACPTGREHKGLDVFMVESLKPFQAVADGTVETIDLFANEVTGNWQVNVRIRYDSWYSVEYAFEPFSTERAAGERQLANIPVTLGQRVRRGDLIGRLVHAGDAPHVHFHLNTAIWWREQERPCPERYFTAAARASILTLVRRSPGIEQMCY